MYTIKKAAELMSISAHTLRFYANKGLFPFIERDYNNIRWFSLKDLEWIELVKCLRKTGMSVSDIRKYIELCKHGDRTLKKRYKMILEQYESAKAELAAMKDRIEYLEYKKEFYTKWIEKGEQPEYNNPASTVCELDEIRQNDLRCQLQDKSGNYKKRDREEWD